MGTQAFSGGFFGYIFVSLLDSQVLQHFVHMFPQTGNWRSVAIICHFSDLPDKIMVQAEKEDSP